MVCSFQEVSQQVFFTLQAGQVVTSAPMSPRMLRVISTVYLSAHYGEIGSRSLKRVRFEREIDRWHSNFGSELRHGLETFESILPHWIFVFHRFITCSKN